MGPMPSARPRARAPDSDCSRRSEVRVSHHIKIKIGASVHFVICQNTRVTYRRRLRIHRRGAVTVNSGLQGWSSCREMSPVIASLLLAPAAGGLPIRSIVTKPEYSRARFKQPFRFRLDHPGDAGGTNVNDELETGELAPRFAGVVRRIRDEQRCELGR